MAIERKKFSAQLHTVDRSVDNVAGFGLCATLLIWRIVHHAFWRDEAQAWLIVQAADSFWDLFILPHEGHPPLYYWILYLTSGLGDDLWLLKIPTLIFAVGTLAVVWFFTPFVPLEKLMISLGYFLSWQYGVFSRSYIVGTFLILLYAALHDRWREYPVLGGLILGAASLTHVFFAMAAACLASLSVFLWLKEQTSIKRILLFSVPFGVCLAVSVISLRLSLPATDVVGGLTHSIAQPLTQPASWKVAAPFNRLASPFLRGLPMPSWPLANLKQFLSILVLGLLIACFWRRPVVGLVFLAGAASIVAFQTVFYGGSSQSGVIYLLFVAVYTIAYAYCNEMAARGLLALSMLAGLVTLPQTLTTPYSASQEAADIITARGLEHSTWVTFPDMPAIPTFGTLKRSVYGLQCGCEFTYFDRARRRISPKSVQELGEVLQKFLQANAQSEVFVLVSKPFLKEFRQLVHDRDLDLIAETEPAINPRENFVIYKIGMDHSPNR